MSSPLGALPRPAMLVVEQPAAGCTREVLLPRQPCIRQTSLLTACKFTIRAIEDPTCVTMTALARFAFGLLKHPTPRCRKPCIAVVYRIHNDSWRTWCEGLRYLRSCPFRRNVNLVVRRVARVRWKTPSKVCEETRSVLFFCFSESTAVFL